VHLAHLWAEGFRNLRDVDLDLPSSGLVLVTGANGQGKTNLLEAIGFVLTLESLRGAPASAVVGADAERATLVGVLAPLDDSGASRTLGLELTRSGRARARLDHKTLRRASDLADVVRALAVTPDDVTMVQAGPDERRRFLDGVIVAVTPARHVERSALERIVRQRNALLRQVDGRLDAAGRASLDVWDHRLAESGERWVRWREEVVEALEPRAQRHYEALAAGGQLTLRYIRSWVGPLAEALAKGRQEDVARRQGVLGPHRDDLEISINALPARVAASRGEQRSAMVSLKLAEWELVSEAAGRPALLLLDDVLSELDIERGRRLIRLLPASQTILTLSTESEELGGDLSARSAARLTVVAGTVRP